MAHLTNLKQELNASTLMISHRWLSLHADKWPQLDKLGLDQFSSHGIPKQWKQKIDGNYLKEAEELKRLHGVDTQRESHVSINTTIIISEFMKLATVNACLSISVAPQSSTISHGHQLRTDLLQWVKTQSYSLTVTDLHMSQRKD